MDAILNNPFRILGLPTTASDKEIAKRVSDLLIYAEMGKKVSYETDFPFLGEIDRSIESIKYAAKKFELPENKIFYSLLWFDVKDSFDKKSIEFLKQGEFESAINLLTTEIFSNCPIVYSSDKTIADIQKDFRMADNNNYSIKKIPKFTGSGDMLPSKLLGHNYLVCIKTNTGLIDIEEGCYNINLSDKYQIMLVFKWVQTSDINEASIGLGLVDNSNSKYFIRISKNGSINFYGSKFIVVDNPLSEAIFKDKNYIAIKRINNYIEVILNDILLLKIESSELFQSSFLCFSGKQLVLIENFYISLLSHRKRLNGDIEINEKTFSYSKNLSIIYLLQILNRKKIEANFIFYFELIENYFRQPYFTIHTKTIVSPNYICNFSKLTDIIVQEFYFSLKHLIDANDENSQLGFYGCFRYLSDEAEKKAKIITLGSKPFIFENFLKGISEQIIKDPQKAYHLACDLKIEGALFLKWYSGFYGLNAYEYKSISDKIGSELLECSILHYNSKDQKDIYLAKQSLNLLDAACDFALNKELRDRIIKNISVLVNSYEIYDYKIIDFDSFDKTRYLKYITYKGSPINVEPNKIYT